MKTIRVNANFEDLKTCRMNRDFYETRHYRIYSKLMNTEEMVNRVKNVESWVALVHGLFVLDGLGKLLDMCKNQDYYKTINRKHITNDLDLISLRFLRIKDRGNELMDNWNYTEQEKSEVWEKVQSLKQI